MRKLFWIVLLANVVAFAGIRQGWFVRNDQATISGPPLNAEMIRVLETPPASSRMNSAPASSAPPAAAPAQPAPVVQSSPPTDSASPDLHLATAMAEPENKAPAAPVCVEWGDFSGTDLGRATSALAAMQFGDKLSRRQIERDIGYWVYIPPLRNKAGVNKKVGELKDLGIHEYFVVSEGRWRNAISMGVFKSNEAAQNYLTLLRSKGVHSARVGERASKLMSTMFRISGVDEAAVARIAALQKDFPGSELKHVPCAPAPQSR